MNNKIKFQVEDADECHAFLTIDGKDVVVMRRVTKDPVFEDISDLEKNHGMTGEQWQTVLNTVSAAPDLLEACKEILRRLSPEDGQSGQCWLCSDALHPTDDDKTIVDYLREILAKAEGK